jgi:hypothetical protein
MTIEYAEQIPTYVTQLAESVVTNGYGQFIAYANNALGAAYGAFAELQSFEVEQIPVTVTYQPVGTAGEFIAPPVPTRVVPELVVPPDPDDVDFDEVNILNTAGTPPPAPSVDYDFVMPADKPDPLTAEPPVYDVVLDEVIMPDEPDVDDVTLRDFYEIDLPDAPVFEEIEFEGVRPEIDFEVPAQTFSFTETTYSSDLLTLVKEKITLMAGGIGLTAEQELAAYERARSREDSIALGALQQEDEKFASRGFSIPNGILAKQRRIVQQTHQSAALEHSRKVELDNKLLMIDSLKTAIAQGIACEGMLLTAHLAAEERRFLAAKFVYESLLTIFNARITLFNARVQAYQADAQVFRDRIQAQIAQVERYRAQIQAEQVKGEMNKTLVDLYEAQVRATLVLVERYKASVEAAVAMIEGNKARVDVFRTRVQAFGEVVRAWGIEWDAYAKQVDAAKGPLEAGAIAAQMFGTRVSAWNTKRQADFERARIEQAGEQLKLQKFDGDIRKFVALLEAARSRVSSEASALQAEAQVYAAGGQIAQAASAAKDRVYQLEISRATNEAQLQLRRGEILVQQAVQASAQLLEAKRGMAQVTTQLAASAMNTINISGQIGAQASGSMNFGQSTSYNYSGDAPVLAP